MAVVSMVSRRVRLQRRRCLAALAALAWSARQGRAAASAWPSRELRLVVPAEPGGGMDALARVLAAQLQAHAPSGVSVVVLNRSGAAGAIGTASVARAAGDGTMLLFSGSSHLAAPLLQPDAGYDALTDFVPLAAVARSPNVLVVHASLKDVPPDRLWRAKTADGRELAYASAGIGTTSHLAAELLMARTGARWLHLPHRGSSPALRALLAGDAHLMLVPSSSLATALGSGRAAAVAVASAARLAQWPELPTLAQLGVADADFAQWYALWAPATTPRALVETMTQRLAEAAAVPALRQHLAEQSMQPLALAGEAFAAFQRQEQARLVALLQRVGLRQ